MNIGINMLILIDTAWNILLRKKPVSMEIPPYNETFLWLYEVTTGLYINKAGVFKWILWHSINIWRLCPILVRQWLYFCSQLENYGHEVKLGGPLTIIEELEYAVIVIRIPKMKNGNLWYFLQDGTKRQENWIFWKISTVQWLL